MTAKIARGPGLNRIFQPLKEKDILETQSFVQFIVGCNDSLSKKVLAKLTPEQCFISRSEIRL